MGSFTLLTVHGTQLTWFIKSRMKETGHTARTGRSRSLNAILAQLKNCHVQLIL